MKVLGIISEYNPFHNGHKYQIEQARLKTGADYVVIVMSGSFVQRGTAAICDKWARAKMALLGGADLIIELPIIYCMQSAEYFAKGAVEILNALGVVNYLSFGVENDNIRELTSIAGVLLDEPQNYKTALNNALSTGISFPSAREIALKKYIGIDNILGTPNNILAIEYIKALMRIVSKIEPVAVLRKGAMHDSIGDGNITSASHIRSLLLENGIDSIKKYVPEYVYEILEAEIEKGKAPVNINSLETAIITRLRTISHKELSQIRDVTEGLENRIKQAANVCTTLDEIINFAKTKRYTHSRLRRIISNTLIGITKSTEDISPQYIRVLGMNENGRAILKIAKETVTLPIIIKTADAEENEMLNLDFTSTDIYTLMFPNTKLRTGMRDKLTSPKIL